MMAMAQTFSFFVNVHVMVASVVDACLWRFEMLPVIELLNSDCYGAVSTLPSVTLV